MNTEAKIGIAWLIVTFCVLAATLLPQHNLNPVIPKCQEDVVLVGMGNFEDGRWDYYTCGPALDDFGGNNDIPD